MAVKWPVNASFLLLMLPLGSHAMVACNVATSGVAFGNYDVFNLTDTTSMGAVDITCSDIGGAGSLNVTISIAISASNTSGTVANRQMSRTVGVDRLNYNLFQDAALTQVWGDTPGINELILPKMRVPNNGTISTSVMIYGKIPAGQDVSAGSYNDRNVLTIFY